MAKKNLTSEENEDRASRQVAEVRVMGLTISGPLDRDYTLTDIRFDGGRINSLQATVRTTLPRKLGVALDRWAKGWVEGILEEMLEEDDE